MRFSVEVQQEQIPELIEQLMGIAGSDVWTRRFAWLKQELRENEHMKEWLLERCGLEWTLMQVVAGGELIDASRYRLDLPGRYELAAFAAGVVAIYGQLSMDAQKRLRGQIVDGLKSDKGLSSLQHEVSTAVHLVQTGLTSPTTTLRPVEALTTSPSVTAWRLKWNARCSPATSVVGFISERKQSSFGGCGKDCSKFLVASRLAFCSESRFQ
jgi:hypothetical protein